MYVTLRDHVTRSFHSIRPSLPLAVQPWMMHWATPSTKTLSHATQQSITGNIPGKSYQQNSTTTFLLLVSQIAPLAWAQTTSEWDGWAEFSPDWCLRGHNTIYQWIKMAGLYFIVIQYYCSVISKKLKNDVQQSSETFKQKLLGFLVLTTTVSWRACH